MTKQTQIIVTAAVAALLSVPASAGQILSFEAAPISPTLPEVILSRADDDRYFFAGPGSQGNGAPTPGGLNVQVPFTGLMAPGAHNIPGGTLFTDVTLVMSSFVDNGLATTGGPFVAQEIRNGFFTFLSSDPDGPMGELEPVNLLTGIISQSVITGLLGATTASFISSTVTYDNGILVTALQNAGFALVGETSWSLLDIDTPLAIADDGRLAAFSANASGLFNAPVVPEPTSMGALALAGAGLLRRRRA